MKTQVGVLPDFLGSTTLVVLASRTGFADLANAVANVQVVDGTSVEEVFGVAIAVDGQRISLRSARNGSCVIEEAPQSYSWKLSEASRAEIRQKLLTLAESEKPAHHYLETEGHIQIIASVGEYSPEVFTRDLRLYGMPTDFLAGITLTHRQ